MAAGDEKKPGHRPSDRSSGQAELPDWLPEEGVELSDDGKTLTMPDRPGKYHLGNKLNDRTNKEWIQFQKSWFVLNPKPRKEDVLLHPAKFPEELVRDFVSFYTKPGETVLDPMAGTGSTLVGALESGRSAVGIELQEKYAEIAGQRVAQLKQDHPEMDDLVAGIHNFDARQLDELDLPEMDYCLTSPPYWDMLKAPGFETQRERAAKGLDVDYSADDPDDIGNIENYEAFLDSLVTIFTKVREVLRTGAYLTVVVKNVKKGPRMYPLAWDLGRLLAELYELKDEKIWCQDNQRLAPYGYRYAWVSNTFHHYCLNFRKT